MQSLIWGGTTHTSNCWIHICFVKCKETIMEMLQNQHWCISKSASGLWSAAWICQEAPSWISGKMQILLEKITRKNNKNYRNGDDKLSALEQVITQQRYRWCWSMSRQQTPTGNVIKHSAVSSSSPPGSSWHRCCAAEWSRCASCVKKDSSAERVYTEHFSWATHTHKQGVC